MARARRCVRDGTLLAFDVGGGQAYSRRGPPWWHWLDAPAPPTFALSRGRTGSLHGPSVGRAAGPDTPTASVKAVYARPTWAGRQSSPRTSAHDSAGAGAASGARCASAPAARSLAHRGVRRRPSQLCFGDTASALWAANHPAPGARRPSAQRGATRGADPPHARCGQPSAWGGRVRAPDRAHRRVTVHDPRRPPPR